MPRVCILAAASMLKLLRIKNIALVAGVELELGAGLTAPDRRNRRRQVDPDRRAGPPPGRPGLRRPHPHRRGAGRRRGARRERRRRAASSRRTACPPTTTRSSCGARSTRRARAGRPSTARWCPVSVLRELAPLVAAIHGQHEPQGLLDPETHLEVARPPRRARPRTRRGGRGLSAACARSRRARGAPPRPRARPSAGARCSSSRSPRSSRRRSRPGKRRSCGRRRRCRPTPAGWPRCPREAYALLYEDEDAVLPRLGQVYRKLEELGAHRPAVRAVPRGPRRPCGRSSRTWRFFLRDYAQTLERHAGPARRDRGAAGADRAAEAEVRRDRRGDAGLRGALAARSCAPGVAGGAGARARGAARGRGRRASWSWRRALSRRRRGRRRELEKRVQRELGAARHGEDALRGRASSPTRRPATATTRRSWTRARARRASSSCSRPTRARSCGRWRASPPAASCRASCSP